MQFNIKDLKPKDLNGQLLPYQLDNVANTIGNVIWGKATTIEWDDIARKIHAGEALELNPTQLEQIEQVLLSDDTPLVLPIKNALKEYFKTLKNQKNVKDSKQKNESTAVAGE